MGSGLSSVLSLYGSVGSSCGFIAFSRFAHWSYDLVGLGWEHLRYGMGELDPAPVILWTAMVWAHLATMRKSVFWAETLVHYHQTCGLW